MEEKKHALKGRRGNRALPDGTQASSHLHIRCKENEIEVWKRTAYAQNMTMGEWVRNILNNNSNCVDI